MRASPGGRADFLPYKQGLIMQLYFPLTAEKNGGGKKLKSNNLTSYKKLVFTKTPGVVILVGFK